MIGKDSNPVGAAGVGAAAIGAAAVGAAAGGTVANYTGTGGADAGGILSCRLVGAGFLFPFREVRRSYLPVGGL